VFGAALEQSQQLFEAAERVTFASRPLLLFYGLSQAGRAIAAASTAASGGDWRLTGHGIEVPNLMQRPALHELTVIDKRSGSFIQLAPLLGSDTLPDGATLGQLWATIPDLAASPLESGTTEYAPALKLEDAKRTRDNWGGWLAGVPQRFATHPTEDDIAGFLSPYPSLAGHRKADTMRTSQNDEIHQVVKISRAWPIDGNADALDWGKLTQPYLGIDDRWVLPAIGGAAQPIHPVLTWWAVLYALSMLARYEPASWTAHLDVDQSQNAVPLEAALGRALDTCPQLILLAIRAVTR
jgi:hypothetical protein